MKEEALKLADARNKKQDNITLLWWAIEAEAIIRRLVEELDKQKYQNELLENSIKFAMLANNLQDKQGEPVAYWDGKHFASKEKSSLADIPLYTTPQTKPLSFDDMVELGKKFDAVWDVNINGSVWFSSVDAFEGFCRAIEERHGIK